MKIICEKCEILMKAQMINGFSNLVYQYGFDETTQIIVSCEKCNSRVKVII